jgi:hypothetical protein
VIVRVAVALVVEPLRDIVDGLTEQPIFAVEEERLHERVTVPLNPLMAVAVIVEVADCPDEEMVTLAGLADSE